MKSQSHCKQQNVSKLCCDELVLSFIIDISKNIATLETNGNKGEE